GVLLFLAVIAGTWFMSTQVASELIPQEDQGTIFAVYTLPPASSLKRTSEVSQHLYEKMHKNVPSITDVVSVPGYDFLASAQRTWAGAMFITLKDWDKRAQTSFDIVGHLFGLGAQIPDAR